MDSRSCCLAAASAKYWFDSYLWKLRCQHRLLEFRYQPGVWSASKLVSRRLYACEEAVRMERIRSAGDFAEASICLGLSCSRRCRSSRWWAAPECWPQRTSFRQVSHLKLETKICLQLKTSELQWRLRQPGQESFVLSPNKESVSKFAFSDWGACSLLREESGLKASVQSS